MPKIESPNRYHDGLVGPLPLNAAPPARAVFARGAEGGAFGRTDVASDVVVVDTATSVSPDPLDPEREVHSARPTALDGICFVPRGHANWTAAELLGGWKNFDSATFERVGWFVDAMGAVHLRGMAVHGSSDAPLFQLPTVARPAHRHAFAIVSNHVLGRIDVDAEGRVLVVRS